MRGVGRTAGAANSTTSKGNAMKAEIKYKTAGGKTGDNVVAIADAHAQKCRAL